MGNENIYIALIKIQTVERLCQICSRYKDEFDIDIVYGRYAVDGTSVLGVASMMGKIVKIVPIGADECGEKCFFEEIRNIGAYKV